MNLNEIDKKLKTLRQLEKKETNSDKIIYYNKEIIKLIDLKLEMSQNKNPRNKLKVKSKTV